MKNIKISLRSILLLLFFISPIVTFNLTQAETINSNVYKKYRVGAKCCDGRNSYTTEKKACSDRGGVKYWIYYDDETKEYSYQYAGRCD